MHRASLNHTYRLVWSDVESAFVAVAENVKGRGKSSRSGLALGAIFMIASCAVLTGVSGQLGAQTLPATLPSGGAVVAGSASIATSGTTLTVTQTTALMAADWQSFNIGQGHTVNFVQPSATSVALNRVLGADVSVIQGALNANGQVFLINPNGVMFTPTAQVNVGGIVASTLNVSTADFMAGNYQFEGSSANAIVNQGSITATGNAGTGGTVALIAAKIINTGTLIANQGNVLLGAGAKVTLDLGGPVKLQVEQGAIDALIEQGGAIRADGSLVYLTAKAAGSLTRTVINHTGVTKAQTLATGEKGEIFLMGGMEKDRIVVGGTLDASAPNGGDGGFIETSAAKVAFADGVQITTAAANGQTGQWLIDPVDFTVAAAGGDITASALGTLLASNNVTIETIAGTDSATQQFGATGTNGDIFVNDAVSWSANNTLTLNAFRNIGINQNITASGATGKLVLQYGQGAVEASNTATYNIAAGKKINLQAGTNFSTKLGSDGAVNNFTVVNTQAALQAMNSTLGGKFALGTDLTFTGVWTPVGTNGSAFTGWFDGLGHTVSNMTMSNASASYVGLFGATNNSVIQNIGLLNVSVAGNAHVGSLVGYNGSGKIANAYASGGSVSGTERVGGLIGSGAGWIETITNSYAAVAVSGTTNWVGGLVGIFTGGTITNSYATGSVTGNGTANYVGGFVGEADGGTTIDKAYATGAVTGGTSAMGGFAASCAGPTCTRITNSYWNMDTSGRSTSAGGTGKTTAQMKALATYTGWDIVEDSSLTVMYPQLTMTGVSPVWRVNSLVPTPSTATTTTTPANAASQAAITFLQFLRSTPNSFFQRLQLEAFANTLRTNCSWFSCGLSQAGGGIKQPQKQTAPFIPRRS